MSNHPDADIDLRTDFKPDKFFSWARASQVREDKLTPHPCGVHPQSIPVDPVSGLAAIPFKEADECGYAKIDFLHLSLLNFFETRSEIDELIKIEPRWNLLLVPEHQEKLFQLSKHGDILDKVQPKSVDDLADVLALIRPGKIQLLDEYVRDKKKIRPFLFTKDKNGFQFKKSHSYAYAYVIILQLHLIDAGLI